jgi:hypothetical protein
MPKGLFTQSCCVLLSEPVSVDVISNLLVTFPILKVGSPSRPGWIGGGDYVLIDLRDKINGRLLVDIVDQPWPDGMGDSKAEPELFAAWSMGYFGPFAYPGNLQRAVQFCQRCPSLREKAPRHKAFIRLRTSYALGADADAPLMPQGYSYKTEMLQMGKVVDHLLTLPEAICYFNPNGEILLTRQVARDRAAHFLAKKLPPIELWCNTRYFNPGAPGWTMMDIIGMEQIDLPDSEAYAPARYGPNDLAIFLFNTSLYMATQGPVLREGSLINGPGGKWRVRAVGDAKALRPRRVLRWFPEEIEVPGELLG